MRITESRIRRIIREEASQVLREGFNTSNGMPTDAAGVAAILNGVGPKLAKTSDISKQEYWTIYMLFQIASRYNNVLENTAQQIVKNDAAISKHLGINDEPASTPAKKQDGNDDPNL
jgi:hypothetical protein